MRFGPKLEPGDRVAVVSPSFAAPGFAPGVHEQAMRRVVSELELQPVEYPSTRQIDAPARTRADDINAALADPGIRAVFATLGGDDQITVLPYLDANAARDNPKPFFGYSDNTNILNWLWGLGIGGYYGGSTQIHLGSGPYIDPIHLASLRAALFDGGSLEITEPGESEDFGPDWQTPEALSQFGWREPSEPWHWSGPSRVAEGHTWGGCVEVIDQLAVAGQLPDIAQLQGGILLLESSEELTPVSIIRRWVRALGERGVLAAVDGVMVARPPVTSREYMPPAHKHADLRAEQRDAVMAEIAHYNPDAVVCFGVPFGHTRPQWVLPYGGSVRLDGAAQIVTAYYG